MCKVSVLLPVYNTKEEYLKVCIDSILNQSYADFELIIINDGSTDKKVREVIQRYKDSRIKYYENIVNMGISGVRNMLVELAQGEYLAIMDHDDICMNSRFEKQVAFLDSHPTYGVVGSWHGFCGSEEIFRRRETNNKIKTNLLWECMMHHPTTMIRKDVLVKGHIKYREEFSPCEDYSLWLDLLPLTKFYNIQENLLIYRNNYKNTTNQDLGKIEQQIQNIFKYYRQKYWLRYTAYRVLFVLRVISRRIRNAA